VGMLGDKAKFQQSIDEMVQTLCPGGISLRMSRIDTKAKHSYKFVYEADCHQLRMTGSKDFIREAICGEFDNTPSSGPTMERYPNLRFQSVPFPNEILRSLKKYIPRLWVMVSDKGNGTIMVTALYRGPAMWSIADREGRETAIFEGSNGLSDALVKIQECEGFDEVAWKQFVKRYWDASVLSAAIFPAKRGVIN
jgi:hypothetical protein